MNKIEEKEIIHSQTMKSPNNPTICKSTHLMQKNTCKYAKHI